MMRFKDFLYQQELLEKLDIVVEDNMVINESQLGDLEIANVIQKGLDKIEIPDIKKLIGTLAAIANKIGAKTSDIIKLFSPSGIKKIKKFISDGIIDSREVQNILHSLERDRYKGYKGFEQFVADMKEDNPALLDSIKDAVKRLIA